MATIRSAIQIADGMSPALRSMNQALNVVINSFESMQRLSSKAVDTSTLQQARVELAKVETNLDGIESSIRQATEQQNKLNQSMQSGGSIVDGVGSKIKKMVSGLMGLAAVRGGINFVRGSMELDAIQTNAENQLRVTLSNVGAASDAYDELKKKASQIQSRGIYGDEAFIAGVAEFATYMKDTDALKKMMDTLADYSIGMSGGGALDTQAIVQYATNLGKITNGAFDAMTKKGFTFTDAQKAIINGTATEIQYIEVLGEKYKDMTQDMRVATTIGDVIGESWSGLYESMSNTPQGAIIALKNAWGDIREEIGERAVVGVMNFCNAIRDNLPSIQAMCMDFATAVAWISTQLGYVVSKVAQVAEYIKVHWATIGPIVAGITAAFITYKAVLLITKTASVIATIAQNGLNAALMACPINWIALGIAAVIGVLVLLASRVAKTSDTVSSFFGVLCGWVNVGLVAVKDFCLGSANFFIGLWDVTLACCTNMRIAFSNSILSIQSSFYGLMSTAITVIAKICEYLNRLPFISFDFSGVVNKADEYAKKAQEISNSKEKYTSVADAFNKGNSTYEVFKEGWTKDAFKVGAAWGDGVVDKIKGKFTLDGYNDEVSINTASTAANTAAMRNSMDTLTDSLEYMIDIAEREAINRYTTAEIRVDMTNNNNISGSNDIDGIVDALSEKVYEAMLVSAEGVHF